MKYEPARPEDLQPIVALLVEAYHCDPALTAQELQQFGLGGYRLMRDGDTIRAALELIPVGQWFGGRCVPCCAVAMVAADLASRGTGAATTLLRESLDEIRRGGAALAVLYPSATGLYRKVGFERAGALVRYDLPLAGLRSADREGEIQQVALPSPELEEVYRACARRTHGLLERDESFWLDRFDPLRGLPLRAYAVRFDGRAEGYAILARGIAERRLAIREAMFTTLRAGRRIQTLLADHAMMLDTARWWGGPQDPLAHLLGEQQAAAAPQKDWMLRIVDVGRALTGRGYAPGVDAVLHLDLVDPLLAENAGPWQVEVSGGRAQVARGGQQRLRLDIRGLAAMYTGHLDPPLAELLGLASGPAEQLARLGAIFAGPKPYMSDAF